MYDDYQRVAGDQSGIKGNVGSARNEKESTRYIVNVQLQRNLYTILANNVEDPNALKAYFDLTLNPKSKSSKKSTEVEVVNNTEQPKA